MLTASDLEVGSTDDSTPNGRESAVDTVDWQLWCRLCAKEDADNISVFLKNEKTTSDSAVFARNISSNLNIVEAIEEHFSIVIKHNEKLPEMLCNECIALVSSLVDFGARVVKVQQLFSSLLESPARTKSDLQNLRVKYGVLDEEREHILTQQALPEVHYFEEKPKVDCLDEVVFETVGDVENPLEQPRIKLKIKKENTIPAIHDSDEDPINGDCSNDCGDKDFNDTERLDHFTSTDDEDIEDEEMNNSLQDIKIKLLKLRKKKKTGKLKKQKRRTTPNGKIDDPKKSHCVFSCSECPRKFQRNHHFRRHMQVVHAKIEPLYQLSCPQCPRVFTTQYRFDKHLKVHLPLELKKIIPCPYCEKKFTSNSLVQMHIRFIHMEERPFICEECGEAVRTNAALKTHMMSHTDYAPFECEICKKGFKTKVHLKKHMVTHDPNKPVCIECGLQLSCRATLNRHLLVHSNEMQHKCDYCGRAFKRAKALKNHLILHTGLKPYTCDFCGRTFANGSNCRSHKKKAHPEELAALEAAGGGKTYTRNIPKLETLKAVTKAAENLEPVVSKQSGHFAYKKSKVSTKDEIAYTTIPTGCAPAAT